MVQTDRMHYPPKNVASLHLNFPCEFRPRNLEGKNVALLHFQNLSRQFRPRNLKLKQEAVYNKVDVLPVRPSGLCTIEIKYAAAISLHKHTQMSCNKRTVRSE